MTSALRGGNFWLKEGCLNMVLYGGRLYSTLFCAPGLVNEVRSCCSCRLFCLALPGSFLNLLCANKVELCTDQWGGVKYPENLADVIYVCSLDWEFELVHRVELGELVAHVEERLWGGSSFGAGIAEMRCKVFTIELCPPVAYMYLVLECSCNDAGCT